MGPLDGLFGALAGLRSVGATFLPSAAGEALAPRGPDGQGKGEAREGEIAKDL